MVGTAKFLRFSQKKLTHVQKKEVKKSANRFRAYFAGVAFAVYGLYCFSTGINPLGSSNPFPADHERSRRLSGGGCPDWVAGQGGGHVVGYLVVTLWMFLGLAVVCDEWFVPSLEKISERLSLSADVAGATFLAAGSSAPEFFTSLADTFSTSNSVGVGTIVGSAMFNILVIVAMAAASTSETLSIDWRPVSRDCGFYAVSILTLILFFQDGKIYWWEGLIMVLVYFLYITFMVFNARIFKMCEKKQVKPEPETYAAGRRKSVHHHKGMFQGKTREVQMADGTQGVLDEDEAVVKTKDGKEINVESADVEAGTSVTDPVVENDTAELVAGDADKKEASGGDDEEDDPNNYFSRFEWPADDSAFDKFLWITGMPFVCLFTITVPDCSKTKGEKYYLVTFIMSIAWIGGLCTAMVQAATWIGCILGIDPIVMGITLLAIGTSVPDALGSMIVARAGEADMAIANAVGSNVFDILLGLGFPWMLRGLINEGNDDICDDTFPVKKCGIELSVAILFGTLAVFFLVLIINKWKMNNKLGIVFLILYLIYIVWILLTANLGGPPVFDVSGGCVEPLPPPGCPGNMLPTNATVATATPSSS